MPPGCFQRLGAIGLMCRMEEEASPVLDIWAVTSESQGVFLLRVSQSQVDAVQPEGRVAGTADDYVKVCVRENREIEVSMGPGPDGKIHKVNLAGSVHGPVLGTWDTYAGLSTMQKTILPDAIRQPPTVGPQAPRPDGSVVHVVKQDETLFLIASAYNVTDARTSWSATTSADSDHVLRPGQELLIREGATSSGRQLPTVSPPRPRARMAPSCTSSAMDETLFAHLLAPTTSRLQGHHGAQSTSATATTSSSGRGYSSATLRPACRR